MKYSSCFLFSLFGFLLFSFSTKAEIPFPKGQKEQKELMSEFWAFDTVRMYQSNELSHLIIHQYDSNGNILTDQSLLRRNQNLTNYDSIHYAYNSKGLNTRIENFSWVHPSWTPKKASSFEYNKQNLIAVENTFTWNISANQWQKENRNTYTYYANGLMASHFLEKNSNGSWEAVYKDTFSYTSSDLLSHYLRLAYKNGNAIPYSESKTTYDENDNIILVLHKSIPSQSTDNIMANALRESYRYENNLETLYVIETWEDGQWINVNRHTKSYNESQLMDTSTREVFDINTKQWVNAFLEINTYNAENLCDTLRGYEWGTHTWYNTYTYSFFYDSKNQLIEYLRDGVDNDVSSLQKYIFMYDEEGNTLSNEASIYNSEKKEWEPQDVYNLELRYNEGKEKILSDYVIANKLSASYLFLKKNSPSIQIENSSLDQKAIVYPNPCQDLCQVLIPDHLQAESYSIYDMNARRISGAKINRNEKSIEINTQNIPKGIYHFVLESSSGKIRQKLVIL